LVAACRADDRVVAAFLGGSRARGADDTFSDIDVTVLVRDDHLESFRSDRPAFLGEVGRLLFLEDFGLEHVTFAIFEDGVELELHAWPIGELGAIEAGPHRLLYDPQGLLEGAAFTEIPPDAEALRDELRQVLMWFWHELDPLQTALGRGQIWWAAGQLEQVRNACVRVARLEGGVGSGGDEPYWKIDAEFPTDGLEPLRPTFVPPDLAAMLAAALGLLAFFREHGRAAARRMDVPYPDELDALIGGALERLVIEG